MKKFNILALCLLFLSQVSFGQRYISEVFSDVTITDDVTYGVNATVLLLGTAGEAVPEELKATIYEPTGDTETDRPVAVLLHTGNFLPPTLNGGCGGLRQDADIVTMANSLAKRGFVVMAISYRLGWNPVAPDQSTRVFTLINAAYRGVQDSRTAARYLRKSVAEDGNPYNIDPDKISMIGFGTGGYITSASAALDTITDTFIPKFFIGATPMVIEEVNGNVDGTTVGIVPPGFPGFPAGDTLCYPNHVGYSSEFNLAVNLGGALGDTSWIDADDVPLISYHVPTDPFAPCFIGTVLVPPPVNLPVVEVMGSCTIQPIIDRLGVNDVFKSVTWLDDITAAVSAKNGGIEGFVPFPSSDPEESAPWNFTFALEPYGVMGSNCDTSTMDVAPYLDTVYQYMMPRTCLALGIDDCDLNGIATSVENVLQDATVGLTVMPNPAYDHVTFTTDKAEIKNIYLFDLSGKLIMQQSNVNAYNYNLLRRNIMAGMYIAQLQFDEGIISKKIVFN